MEVPLGPCFVPGLSIWPGNQLIHPHVLILPCEFGCCVSMSWIEVFMVLYRPWISRRVAVNTVSSFHGIARFLYSSAFVCNNVWLSPSINVVTLLQLAIGYSDKKS